MYIREVSVKAKGHKYTTHRLVEAYKNKEGKPRQRVIMNLGKLDIPKSRLMVRQAHQPTGLAFRTENHRSDSV
jgi:hypothetical protein